jgi:hypothetical protein
MPHAALVRDIFEENRHKGTKTLKIFPCGKINNKSTFRFFRPAQKVSFYLVKNTKCEAFT